MSYQNIVEHYEKCFEKYGDNFKGVDWPNEKDTLIRYKVMLDIDKINNQLSTSTVNNSVIEKIGGGGRL